VQGTEVFIDDGKGLKARKLSCRHHWMLKTRKPQGWVVATCALEHGLYSAEALAEHKRARELLTQSRELLKQMQAG